jgi:membrane protein DedA with SNARE-associated domain
MDILASLYIYRYLGIFLGTIIEGPVIMTAVGFLVKLGHFNFWLAYILMVLGDLVGDIGWYYAGYFGAKNFIEKFGRFFGINKESMEKVKTLFYKHHSKILLLSKITMGFGLSAPILVTAGISKVPIKKFIILNLIGGFIWTAFLMTLGYFFGNIYLLISEGLRVGFIALVIILVSALLFGFSKFLRSRVLKNKIS